MIKCTCCKHEPHSLPQLQTESMFHLSYLLPENKKTKPLVSHLSARVLNVPLVWSFSEEAARWRTPSAPAWWTPPSAVAKWHSGKHESSDESHGHKGSRLKAWGCLRDSLLPVTWVHTWPPAGPGLTWKVWKCKVRSPWCNDGCLEFWTWGSKTTACKATLTKNPAWQHSKAH